ncbi:MAG: hypothetical protein ACI4ET_07155 [Bilifractor sp.]
MARKNRQTRQPSPEELMMMQNAQQPRQDPTNAQRPQDQPVQVATDIRNGHQYAQDHGTPDQSGEQEWAQNPANSIIQAGNDPEKPPIGKEQVRKARFTLQKYKEGKQQYEDQIIRDEKWFKMRHWDLLRTPDMADQPEPASGWLFNTITSKHADFMDNFPQPDILPREPGDKQEAEILSSIVPVILEQNDFRKVYSDEVWYKLKHGTGIFGVFWDSGKLNGLGDVTIRSIDVLNLFWQPGVKDIQDSENLFNVELVDNDRLTEAYPQLIGKLGKGSDSTIKKYYHDENIETSNKSAVIDWYYKKNINGKITVQLCKFVNDEVLYATENNNYTEMQLKAEPVYTQDGMPATDRNGNYAVNWQQEPVAPSMRERGLYDHGLYPFVFDPLWKEQDSPCGFGFVQVCKSAQTSIDIFNAAIEKNVQYTCNPRYFVRNDGGINEEEFSNPQNLLVHVDGNLGEDSMQPVESPTLVNSNYINILTSKIDEMKEIAGNRDVSNGGITSGVTAASGIAAMMQSSGKTSRDQIATTYEAYKDVVTMVIELIRQFYDMPRQFRITGKNGQVDFVEFDNTGLQPESLGNDYGVNMGYRLPVFDIKVDAEKENVYTQQAQNEFALQLYSNGMLNPQYADQSLAALDMMEFQGKASVINKVAQNGLMYQQMLQMQQQMLQMAEMIDQLTGGQTNLSDTLATGVNTQMAYNAADVAQRKGAQTTVPSGNNITSGASGNTIIDNAKQRAAEYTQVKS